jgi:LCP family protein required for cell wall assembly
MASRPHVVDPDAPLPPHLDPRGRHRGHGAGLAAYRLVGRTFGVLLSVGLLLLAGYFWLTYRSINSGVHRLHVAVGVAPSGKNDIDGTDQNILLVGNDDRSNMTNAEVHLLKVGRDGGSKSTDTMMIVHVPADGSRATLISLPRDSYVKIPGHGMNKLNAAYVFGYNSVQGTDDDKRAAGADLLIRTVTNLTGLTINHYIQVSLMGFYDISNAIGGVNVDLCHNVDDTIAYNRSIGSDGGSGFKMSAGKHTIKGVQALEFVRQRHNLPNGDLDRVRRQQYFLTAAFRKVASVGILFKLKALGDAVKRNVYLDPGLNLIDLAHQMENLSANNIAGKTIPFEHFGNTAVGSVEIVKPARVQRFVQRVINGPTASPSASSSTTPKGGASGSKSTSPKPSSSTQKPLDSKCIN